MIVMSIKKILSKGILILVILSLIATISVAKTRVNIDGNLNINFGKTQTDRNQNRYNGNGRDYWDNNGYDVVGDITDSQYNLKPFLLNGKGYSIIYDNRRLYILQVTFINGNLNKVDREVIYNAKVFSSNCIAIDGDSKYCLTITSKGQPALWDRELGRIKYVGRWLKSNSKYYNDYYNDYDYYDSNNWFEW
jgi:hypothetical protein